MSAPAKPTTARHRSIGAIPGSSSSRVSLCLAWNCRFQDPPNDDPVSGPVHPTAEESETLKYLCLIYEEGAKVDALPDGESAAIAEEDREYAGALQSNGYCAVSGRLQPAQMAARIHVRNGSVLISDLSDIGANERLGEFCLINARDLNDAIRIAAKMPRARLGWIDVRPLEECGLY